MIDSRHICETCGLPTYTYAQKQPVWDEGRSEALRTLWNDGLTASVIAARLGVSRDSVIGRAHRMRLESRPSPLKTDKGSEHVKEGRMKWTDILVFTAFDRARRDFLREFSLLVSADWELAKTEMSATVNSMFQMLELADVVAALAAHNSD